MTAGNTKKPEEARILMNDFAQRTGLLDAYGEIEERYLWTDAFAVQAFFGLAHVYDDESYRDLALKLIEAVHSTLGHYPKDDIRKGWISGLSEKEGQQHPTAGGLRIGKKLPERMPDERFNERLEWERDGQYFHYITRWIHALLQAEVETGDHRYTQWAAELLQAGGKFVYPRGGSLRMYWKMSIDLSRPLIASTGAHDPLEGLICAESILEFAPEKSPELNPLIHDFKKLCYGQDWSTIDPLGIGGLLLNAIRAAELATVKTQLPNAIKPGKLFSDSLDGLKEYSRRHAETPAFARLAFRECGLSLGLRTFSALEEPTSEYESELDELAMYTSLAEEIENFWMNPGNRKASSWKEHLNINVVSLSSSIIAKHYPFAFCAGKTVRK